MEEIEPQMPPIPGLAETITTIGTLAAIVAAASLIILVAIIFATNGDYTRTIGKPAGIVGLFAGAVAILAAVLGAAQLPLYTLLVGVAVAVIAALVIIVVRRRRYR